MTENKTNLIVLCLGTYMLTGHMRCKSSSHIVIILSNFIGVSPSGKAKDFDSFIRKFESCYPCQNSEIFLGIFYIKINFFE